MLADLIRNFLETRLTEAHKKRLRGLIPQRVRRWYAEESADAILISFPKCGRTWLAMMMARVFQRHFGLAEENLAELTHLSDLHPAVPKILLRHDDNPFWKRPGELQRDKAEYRRRRVIFLVRDPRDVMVSSYFHKVARQGSYEGEIAAYLHEPVGSLETIVRYFNIWAESRHVPRSFLLVRYEDLHEDPARELARVLSFLGLDAISPAIIEEAVAFAAFENMRKMERDGHYESGKLRPADPNRPESFKTRKGKVGGFAEYFDQGEIEHMNRLLRRGLSPFYRYRF